MFFITCLFSIHDTAEENKIWPYIHSGNIFLIKNRRVAQGIFIGFTIIEWQLTLVDFNGNKYLFTLGD